MTRATIPTSRLSFVALAVLAVFAPGFAQDSRDRGVTSAPYPDSALRSHAGVFVGVAAFPEDPEGFRALEHGVDDAVAMAALFALELRLLHPSRTFLALGGEPSTPALRGQLDALVAAGAVCETATKSRILISLERGARSTASTTDLLLVYFATHGLEGRERKPHLVPSDALRRFLDATAIPLAVIDEIVASSAAGQRLLVLDSCRAMAATGGEAAPEGDFIPALGAARGAAILTGCQSRQVSHEATGFGHGLYTHFLMEGLRGAAAADAEGVLRVGAVHDYACVKVQQWADERQLSPQEPDLSGEVAAARAIPLAIDPTVHRLLADFRSQVGALVPKLRARIDPRGPFGGREAERIEQLLARARPDDFGRGVARTCESFLAQEISDWVFASYVNGFAEFGSKRVPRWATLVRADPDPSVVTDAVALASLRAQDVAWRVTDTKTGIELILVPPGSYLRGSPEGEAGRDADEGPQHRVIFTKAFYLGVSEVTNAQYRRHFEADHDSGAYQGLPLNGGDQPVVEVSWEDAMEFCAANGFRLPSEAEWEYAARGGTTTAYPWGDDPRSGKGWANAADATAKRQWSTWTTFPWEDGFEVTAPVGRFVPNGFGLHDMIGNVWEICADSYRKDAYEGCQAGVENPSPLDDGARSERVWRGGSWNNSPTLCRSALRDWVVPTDSREYGGFRVARTP